MDVIASLKSAHQAVKKFLTTQQSLDEKLVEAVKAGDIAKVRAAAAAGGNPSVRTRTWPEQTPMLLAIEAKNTEMLKALLELKADPNAKIGDGEKTTLTEAVRAGQTEMAIALVEAKADINAGEENTRSPFLLAVATANKKLIELFAEKGAKLDVVDSKGWSPLSYAVRNGDVPTIEFLVSKSVRTDRRDEDDRTLLDIARAYDRPAAVKALLTHYDSLVPKWQKLEDADEVTHVSILRDAGYKLTEVFNLRTERLTTVTHNFETGRDETVSRGLNDGDKVAVAEAKARLATLKPQPVQTPVAAA